MSLTECFKDTFRRRPVSWETYSRMQVNFWIVLCCCVLLKETKALISDEECTQYHELRSSSDYDTFVDDCAGKEVFGFENGVAKKFNAGLLEEKMFNRLFKNAREIGFHIYVENTDFEELKLPKLEKLEGGITIRNNPELRSFRIRRGFKFSRKSNGPTTITVDGNAKLNAESMADLRSLCSYCDIFEWTKCSAIEPLVSDSDYASLIEKCQGEKIIKSKPQTKLFLDLSKISQDQFDMLFSRATHVEMCINMRDVPWTQLVFPKLLRLIPCGPGDRALKAVHNSILRMISFPSYNSEGFGRLNAMINIEFRNNFVLPEFIITSLRSSCRFCTLQVYKECDQIEPRQTRNATKFVELCGGKKIWKPAKNYVLELDISRLSQDLVDELFQDVTTIKMCITLRQSQLKHLRMLNLVELHTCQAGRAAFTIEANMKLEKIEVASSFRWDICKEAFHVVLSPALKAYPSFDQCEYCVLELNTKCGATGRRLSYTSLSDVLQICPRKRKIVFRETVTISEEKFTALCSEARYLEMGFNIVNSDYAELNFPKLYSIRPPKAGKPIFTIIGNSHLEVVKIPPKVIYPRTEKIFVVKRNPRIPQENIALLKKICPHCDIEGFFSKCNGIDNIQTFEEFMEKCAGQSIISGKHGLVLKFNFTEQHLNRLFSEAIEVQLCLNIQAALIQKLVFPKLTKWKSCAAGKPAINIVNNPYLETISLPACTAPEGCIDSGVVKGNPELSDTQLNKIHKWCPHCLVEKYVPACGLGTDQHTMRQLAKACAGQQIIKPSKGATIVLDSTEVTEVEMNKLCSSAVYMEACIRITESSYKEFRCPQLKILRPCKPGRPALEFIGNALLEVIRIPPTVNIPRVASMKHPKTIVVSRNPLLLPSVIEELKAICPACPIYEHYSRCSRLPAIGNIASFIEQCAGQPIITGSPGVELNLELNEDQLLALFSDAIEVQMCITVKRSSIRKLSFPKLARWRSCSPDKAGFTITTNPYLERIEFPSCVDKSCLQSGVIRGNPSLPKEQIDAIRRICTDCIMEYDVPTCGLGNAKVSVREIVNACSGKEIIMPAENASIIIDASQVTELELNRMCSKVFYMKACIIMKGTNFKHLRCPNLQEFTHCQPGKPVFEIVGNNMLQEVAIPTNVVFPEGEKVLVVLRNPELPPQAVATLRKICPYCEIVEFFSKCGNVDNIDDIDAFLKQCSGQTIIMGQPGLTLDADLTEAQLNRLFSGAVEVQLCLTVRSSAVERLIFPKLQRWTPCAPGKASITIASNPSLKEVAFPACQRKDCITNGVIYNNPLLPRLQIEIIKKFCTNCRLESYVPACGLGVRKYTVRQFVTACSGKEIIKPPTDSPLIIDARQFTEEEINKMCSRAVYLEACVVLNGTPFNSLRCPHLRQMASCKPGKPVFDITDNSELEVVEIPTSVTFPKKEKVLVVRRNPKLPMPVIASLKKICPYCDIQYFSSKCINMPAVNDVADFLSKCTGEPTIIGKPGLVLDVKELSELQLNKLFENVYHLKMCLVLNGTQIRKLVFPKLVEWKSCSHDKPAIAVVDNLQLREFRFPSCRVTGCIESGLVKGNRRLPLAEVKQFGEWCTNCVFETYVPACGILKARYTVKEFVKACAGKEVIRPRDDYFVTIDSSEVTEDEMNRFCSAAVVMQVCIDIRQSSYKKLHCPHLRELIPCKPGRPAITITQNPQFELLYVPQRVEFPKTESIVEIWGNPQMQPQVIESLRRWCPRCKFGGSGGGKLLRQPKNLLNCALEPRVYDDQELASTCAGFQVIKPRKGFYLRLSSDLVTEAEMNAMCAKAVYMEICITIRGSNYKSLRCPYLREIRPCLPGHAALTVVDNIHLVDLILPKSIVLPEGVNVFEIYENPHISIEVIELLKTKCEQCKITANLGCDLERRTYTDKEVVDACAGKRIIRPAKGFMLWLKSQTTTEKQVNALCAKAVFMEICIDIMSSQFKQLRCPHLKELVPCKPGRPAIRILNNLNFENFVIPEELVFSSSESIFEISGNPHLPTNLLARLKKMCPKCKISSSVGCLLAKQIYSDDELVEACSGKKVIKPAEGFMLTLRKATEEQINALCSEAIFMKICIDISHSNIRNIRCPQLRELQSCLPDRPAIRIVDNQYLRTFSISNTFIHQRGAKLIEIHGNKRLSTRSIETLKQLCPECDIRR